MAAVRRRRLHPDDPGHLRLRDDRARRPSLSFLLGSASGIASTPVEGILLGIVISTASALALLGLYLLSYHFISNMRDRWQADQLDQWTEWWVGLALTGPGEPGVDPGNRRRLPRVAVHSVLSLLEASRARRATG